VSHTPPGSATDPLLEISPVEIDEMLKTAKVDQNLLDNLVRD